jgi:phosphoserine aminotransferase
VQTRNWSKKAIGEARKFCDVSVVANSQDENFTCIPDEKSWNRNPGAAYLHYCPSETIHGVEFHFVPDTGDMPLVADMWSTILSRPIEVSKFGVIYAGAQKNVGPAGLTLVIVRKDLTAGAVRSTEPPRVGGIREHRLDDQYAADLCLVCGRPGVRIPKGERRPRDDGRAQCAQGPKALPSHRRVLVLQHSRAPGLPFVLADPGLDARFLADAAGLLNLKGHGSVGGMRASLYNAMPEAGVDALIDFVRDFERRRT